MPPWGSPQGTGTFCSPRFLEDSIAAHLDTQAGPPTSLAATVLGALSVQRRGKAKGPRGEKRAEERAAETHRGPREGQVAASRDLRQGPQRPQASSLPALALPTRPAASHRSMHKRGLSCRTGSTADYYARITGTWSPYSKATAHPNSTSIPLVRGGQEPSSQPCHVAGSISTAPTPSQPEPQRLGGASQEKLQMSGLGFLRRPRQ